jgi:hypothetical protein
MLADALRLPHYGLTGGTEKADTSLVTQGWVGDKLCRVTVDTGAYVTVASELFIFGYKDAIDTIGIRPFASPFLLSPPSHPVCSRTFLPRDLPLFLPLSRS